MKKPVSPHTRKSGVLPNELFANFLSQRRKGAKDAKQHDLSKGASDEKLQIRNKNLSSLLAIVARWQQVQTSYNNFASFAPLRLCAGSFRENSYVLPFLAPPFFPNGFDYRSCHNR
jgi:hypothetical protein